MKNMLRPVDVCKMLHTTLKTLRKMRDDKVGPRYIQLGNDPRYIRYMQEDVEKWVYEKRSKSVDF